MAEPIHASRRRPVNTILRAIALAAMGASAAQAQTPACDRACLTGFVDAWAAALKANDARALPQAAKARITENGAEKKLGATFWAGAQDIVYRFDIVNTRRGDTGSELVVRNADGSKTMIMLRLKVRDGSITEIETIKANKGDADSLWDPDRLTQVSPNLKLSIRVPERDSYYDLIATADGYFRAFQTNGTPNYHKAKLLPDSMRFENGLQTTGLVRDGVFNDTARGFDEGRFVGRNIWDRRYAVVDEERGAVLALVRFGLKAGAKAQNPITAHDRLVGELFAIKAGHIQEITAVLTNLPDDKPTGWPADDGPARGSAE